jgi:hypothetical protein
MALVMKRESYKQDLEEAQKMLSKKLQERAELDMEIAQLRQDIGSLAQLCGVPHLDIKKLFEEGLERQMGLTDACIEVLKATDEPLTPAEVKEGLIRIGFDVSAHSNILASIHTTLRRLADDGITKESDKDGKRAYKIEKKNYILRAQTGKFKVTATAPKVRISKTANKDKK